MVELKVVEIEKNCYNCTGHGWEETLDGCDDPICKVKRVVIGVEPGKQANECGKFTADNVRRICPVCGGVLPKGVIQCNGICAGNEKHDWAITNQVFVPYRLI